MSSHIPNLAHAAGAAFLCLSPVLANEPLVTGVEKNPLDLTACSQWGVLTPALQEQGYESVVSLTLLTNVGEEIRTFQVQPGTGNWIAIQTIATGDPCVIDKGTNFGSIQHDSISNAGLSSKNVGCEPFVQANADYLHESFDEEIIAHAVSTYGTDIYITRNDDVTWTLAGYLLDESQSTCHISSLDGFKSIFNEEVMNRIETPKAPDPNVVQVQMIPLCPPSPYIPQYPDNMPIYRTYERGSGLENAALVQVAPVAGDGKFYCTQYVI